MPLRAPLSLSALALALLVPAAGASAAPQVQPVSVSARFTTPSHATTVALRCPGDAVALHGAITRKGAGVVVRRSAPRGVPGRWTFTVAPGGAGSRRFAAVVRCVGLDLPANIASARLNVRTRHRSSIDVPAGAAVDTRVGCGPAWTATGYGLAAGSGGEVKLAAVVPTAHGWRFMLENTGSAEVHAAVFARCVQSRVPGRRRDGGSASLRFRSTRPAQGNILLGDGTRSLLHRCGEGRFSVATGSSVDPADSIELALSTPFGARGGRWTFANASTGDTVATYLVCLGRGSRFH